MMKLLFEIYFAFMDNKLLHCERYYIVTYDIAESVYRVWSVDGSYSVTPFAVCKDKLTLTFTWEILMGRQKLVCH